MENKIEQHDGIMHWRCPQLGGEVPFRHCRSCNNSLPCPQIINCWGGKVDLAVFLRENYSVEELETVFGKPKLSRIETILNAVEKNRGE